MCVPLCMLDIGSENSWVGYHYLLGEGGERRIPDFTCVQSILEAPACVVGDPPSVRAAAGGSREGTTPYPNVSGEISARVKTAIVAAMLAGRRSSLPLLR